MRSWWRRRGIFTRCLQLRSRWGLISPRGNVWRGSFPGAFVGASNCCFAKRYKIRRYKIQDMKKPCDSSISCIFVSCICRACSACISSINPNLNVTFLLSFPIFFSGLSFAPDSKLLSERRKAGTGLRTSRYVGSIRASRLRGWKEPFPSADRWP